MIPRCERYSTILSCHVVGGVSMEPERKTVSPVFSYGAGAMINWNPGCVEMVVSNDILIVMREVEQVRSVRLR